MAKSTCLILCAMLLLGLPIGPSPCAAQDQPPANLAFQGHVETQGVAGFQVAPGEFPALIVPEEADAADERAVQDRFAGPIVTTVSSLLVVLAVFGGLVWVSRRYGASRAPTGVLPEDVLRNLGGVAIDSKTRVTFLKVGQRILVIGQTQSGDPQTLSEITDPDEVRRLTDRCLGRPEIVGRRASFATGMEASRRDLAAG